MSAERSEEGQPGPPDIRAIGQRIETLLDAAAAGGAVALERAEELVRLLTDLYGAGIERMLDLIDDTGRLDTELLDRLAADDLVSNLLLVHGLHPHDVTQRVESALERVRPYLGTHGGDVELIAVTDDIVRLRLLGSCDGCPSSSVTLELAVKEAIEAAAPEVAGIEVEQAPRADASGTTLIPVQSLRTRLDSPDSRGSTWHSLGIELPRGGLGTVVIDGAPLLALRPDADLLVFRNRCPRCESTLEDSRLERRLGGRAAEPVLVCASCGAHFDVCRAGACLDLPELHLDPLPVMDTGSSATVALPAGASV